MSIPFKPPTHQGSAFNCPLCMAYADQDWKYLRPIAPYDLETAELEIAVCGHCGRYSLWRDGAMLHPPDSPAPPPNADLPEDIKADYYEASAILTESPRGAAALLRLAVEKLTKALEPEGDDINDAIKKMVQKGLPVEIQQALDSVRVIGNNAVHPGQIDLKDDVAAAISLFELVSFIADRMISQPKKVAEIYQSLPPTSLNAIDTRDDKA